MTHTLIELSVSAMSHSWLIATVHPVNVKSLDLLDFIHGHITSKWNLIE